MRLLFSSSLVGLTLLLGACGASDPKSAPQLLTVAGNVTLRICGGAIPVDPPPGWSACHDSAKVAQITFTDESGKLVQTVTADDTGAFKASLPAGTYTVSADDGSHCELGFIECPPAQKIVLKQTPPSPLSFQYVINAP